MLQSVMRQVLRGVVFRLHVVLVGKWGGLDVDVLGHLCPLLELLGQTRSH